MSSTTSQTSTTISAHIDFGVLDAGLGTSRAASHIHAGTPPSTDLVRACAAIDFRLRKDEDDQKVPACFGSFWDVPGLDKDDDERDGIAATRSGEASEMSERRFSTGIRVSADVARNGTDGTDVSEENGASFRIARRCEPH